jgi:hypothetical protein
MLGAAMPDVFISYKKEDVARVEPIARGLAQAGYEVWWDHRIPPGRSYRDIIGAALAEAKCVLVIWSNLSANAQWVLDEADEGKRRNVLLPVLIDPVDIPYGFRQIEAARLIGWTGDAKETEWLQLLDSVAHFVARPPGGPAKPLPKLSAAAAPAAAPAVAAKGGFPVAPVVGALALAAVAGGGFVAWQSGMFGGYDPNTEQVALEAPAAEPAPEAEPPTFRSFTPVANNAEQTFFQSQYTYCDAKMLAAVWGGDVYDNKLAIGGKLLNGPSGRTILEDALQQSRVAGNRCGWDDVGYSAAEAEKLATIWGISSVEAQAKAAMLYTAGQNVDVERLLKQQP